MNTRTIISNKRFIVVVAVAVAVLDSLLGSVCWLKEKPTSRENGFRARQPQYRVYKSVLLAEKFAQSRSNKWFHSSQPAACFGRNKRFERILRREFCYCVLCERALCRCCCWGKRSDCWEKFFIDRRENVVCSARSGLPSRVGGVASVRNCVCLGSFLELKCGIIERTIKEEDRQTMRPDC